MSILREARVLCDYCDDGLLEIMNTNHSKLAIEMEAREAGWQVAVGGQHRCEDCVREKRKDLR